MFSAKMSSAVARSITAVMAASAATLLLGGCMIQPAQNDDPRSSTEASAAGKTASGESESGEPAETSDAQDAEQESGAPESEPGSATPAPPTQQYASATAEAQETPETGVRPCAAGELSSTFGAYRNPDGTLEQTEDGSYNGLFQFVNNGSQSCSLEGYPGLVKSNGHAQTPITVSNTLSPAPARIEVAPGGQAAVYVTWFEDPDGACYHEIASFEVHLPEGQAPAEEVSDVQPVFVDIPMSEMTNCAYEYNTSAFYVP